MKRSQKQLLHVRTFEGTEEEVGEREEPMKQGGGQGRTMREQGSGGKPVGRFCSEKDTDDC